MSFESNIWLILTPLLCLTALALGIYELTRRKVPIEKFIAPRLRATLIASASRWRTVLKLSLIVAAIGGLGVALARPQWGIETVEQPVRAVDIFVALDVSRSMLATDISPNRLERAKLAGLDLITRLRNERIGLLVFSGQAFIQCPLTLDYGAFREALRQADPESLTGGGTNIGGALLEAAAAFPEGNGERIVILITDGEDLSDEIEPALEVALARSITVHTVGIGTPEGTTLRVRDRTGVEVQIRNERGEPVVSRLDEESLRLIASRTGGVYERLTGTRISEVISAVQAANPSVSETGYFREIPIERFQWPLAVALLLLMVEPLITRRRSTSSLTASPSKGGANAGGLTLLCTISASLFIAPHAEASEVSPHSTLSPREAFNLGVRRHNEGDLTGARMAYEAALRGNDFEAHRDAFYNLGLISRRSARDALATNDVQTALDELEAASAFLNSALEIDPEDARALQQLDLTQRLQETIQELLDEMEPPESGESDSNDNADEDESNESDPNQDGEGDSSESGDDDRSNEKTPGEDSDSTEENANNEAGDTDEEQTDADDSQHALPEEDEDAAREEDTNAQEDESRDGDEETASLDGDSMDPSEMEEVGFSEHDAVNLLESLRSSERFLPYTGDQPPRRNPRNDW